MISSVHFLLEIRAREIPSDAKYVQNLEQRSAIPLDVGLKRLSWSARGSDDVNA